MATVPGNVRNARHVGDLDDDGHDTTGGGTTDLDVIIAASAGEDVADALAGAAAPDAGNVFATIADIGGGSALPWYDVTDPTYGAVGDGTTDDTVAVQAAIDACMTAGGGTVFFPPGIYQISGALQNTSTHNSQLVIPTTSFSGTSKAIRFLGMGPNRIYGGTPPGGGESIIRSDWNGTISGHPAIISGGTWRNLRESFVYPVFEDLTIIAHDDPKLSAIQMTAVSSVRMNRVQIRTTSADPSSVPTHSNAVAYEGPWGYGSIAAEEFWNIAITGFYVGMRPAEQTHGGSLAFAYCTVAMEFVGGRGTGVYTFGPNYFTKVTIVSCPRGLVFNTDLRWVNIGACTFQHDPGTFATIYDIDDASGPNLARGFISYKAIDTASVPFDTDILRTGGQKLSFQWSQGEWWKLVSVIEIPTGTDPSTDADFGGKLYAASADEHLMWRDSAGTVFDLTTGGTPPYGTPAITLGDTAADGVSTDVIRADATIEAFDDGTDPVNQAFADVADPGNDDFAARRDHRHGMPAGSSGGGVGAILVIDTPAGSPLVFADLLQNDAGTDLLYADV